MIVSQRKVVVPKIIGKQGKVQSSESKVQSRESKVLMMFIIFIQIQLSTNSLFVYQVKVVVSAEYGPFERRKTKAGRQPSSESCCRG